MPSSLELAEVIAEAADELGIELAIIGAMALAAHNYGRQWGHDPGSDVARI